MSLQVWLPLNGDLRNQGLENIKVINKGIGFGFDNKFGKSLYIDGFAGSYVDTDYYWSPKKEFSVCFWVSRTDSGTVFRNSTKYSPVVDFVGSNNNMRVFYWYSESNYYMLPEIPIPANVSTHICVTSSKSRFSVYVNGVLAESMEATNSPYSTGFLQIGNCNAFNTNFWGSLSDFRIYDDCLSESEIREIAKGLCVHYTLNEPNANLVLDSKTQSQSNSAYMVKAYTLSENFIEGQVYTYQIKARLSDEKQMIGVWVGGGTYCAGTSQKNSTGYYKVTFTATASMTQYNTAHVYCSNNTGTQGSTPVTGTCYIDWIKIEKGNKATPWVSHVNDSNATTVSDSSGFGNVGKKYGNIACDYTNKKYDHGIIFDNGIQNIRIPINMKMPEMSCSFWVKPSSSNGAYSTVAAKYNAPTSGLWIATNCEGSGVWAYHGAYMSAGDLLPNNVWSHCVFTFKNGTPKWYVNGVEQTLNRNTYTGTTVDLSDWTIGNSYTGTTWNTKNYGGLSDFRIYATALSADDVLELYQTSFELGKTNLIANEFIETGHNLSLSRFDKTIYTEPDGSKWTRVFHHNNPAGGSFNQSDNLLGGIFIDSNRWFDGICLSQFQNCELMFKEKITSDAIETKYRWTQTNSPMFITYEELMAIRPVYNTSAGYTTPTRVGLWKRDYNDSCFLCADNGTRSNWWGAVCSYSIYQGGIPAVGGVVTTGYLDLYVRIDNINTISNEDDMTRTGILKGNTLSEQGKNLESHLPYTQVSPFQPNSAGTDGYSYVPNSTVEVEPNTTYEFSFRCDGTLSATHASSGGNGNIFTGWLYVSNSMKAKNYNGYDNPINFTSANLYKQDGNKYIWHYKTGDNATVIGLRVNTYSNGTTVSPIKFWDFCLKKGTSDTNPTFSKKTIQSVNFVEK